ncbi:MAG: group II intron reverse transcriptase/maturase [Methanomicrobiales archaeon]|jgi:group II intron reverse transcriptase/maturase|nr:group II intron reverse transcriptase/maturase [Methanomicrobiales archaeon]
MSLDTYDKGRQLQIEGWPHKVSVELKGHAGAPEREKMTENNAANTDRQADRLLEKIFSEENLYEACHKVVSNKGAGGVDGMQVNELRPYLALHSAALTQQLLEGKYKPNPVRRVEIPKEEPGKVRKLGIPTAVDRVIQQAIAQILSALFEPQFHENSYGFRPKRSTHDALKQCQQNVNAGYIYVVDMDLEKFFDTVNQSKLIQVLSQTIKDGRVISLIHKYLNAGVLEKGVFAKTDIGVPQGGPLSPLLSNIMLNELDWELDRRGHKFVRYADDCMIFCKSKRSAERTLANIIPFIERKLFLTVNREKTEVARITEVKFLGYGFYRRKGEYRLKVHPKSVLKMKDKLRELTSRSNGWGDEFRIMKLTRFIRGWVNYFALADMESLLRNMDGWLRRRIRAIYWKQWKKIKTRYSMLKKYGLPDWQVHQLANCRKGIWCAALVLNYVLTNKEIANLGYISMTDYFLKTRVN